MLNKRKYFFLPPNLPINHLNAVLTGSNDAIGRITDFAALFYTILCQDLIRLNMRNELDGYTQVHSDKLKTIFGDKYNDVIDRLVNAELLERNLVSPDGEYKEDGYYSKSFKTARSFRIPKRLRSDDKLFVKVQIEGKNKPKNAVLYNKIDSLNGVSDDPAVLADANRRHVLRMMEMLVLLDDDKTRSIIEADCNRRGIPYSESLAAAIVDKFNYSIVQEPTICDFAGRLHAILTTIIKELRCQVRFADDLDSELSEIDIVSSQPWFLSNLNAKLIKKFVPECKDAAPLFAAVQDEPELHEFRELCSNSEPNGIYDELAKAYNEKYKENFTRNDAKRICFRAFFSNYEVLDKKSVRSRQRAVDRYKRLLQTAQDNHSAFLVLGAAAEAKIALKDCNELISKLKKAESKLFTQKCYELFKAKFPVLHRLFSKVKELQWDFPRGTKSGKPTKYYANNALLAQRLESNVVFGVVVKALVRENLLRVVTIHDAFIVRKQDEAKARKIIKQAFNSVKLKPSFKQNENTNHHHRP